MSRAILVEILVLQTRALFPPWAVPIVARREDPSVMDDAIEPKMPFHLR